MGVVAVTAAVVVETVESVALGPELESAPSATFPTANPMEHLDLSFPVQLAGAEVDARAESESEYESDLVAE